MGTHLTVSIELVLFMKWLIAQKRPQIKNLIHQALDAGLEKYIDEIHEKKRTIKTEELSEGVRSFIDFLEQELNDSLDSPRLNEQSAEEAREELASYGLDNTTLAHLQDFNPEEIVASAQETAHDLKQIETPSITANSAQRKEMLTKHLLENWSPGKKTDIN